MEILLWLIGFYLLSGLSVYAFAVIKSWEITRFWSFKISNGYIAGICPYPRWLLFWLEWLVKKVRGV